MNLTKHHIHALPVGTAAAAVSQHAARMRKEAPRAKRGDVDGIHDMRVASRRLRVALREARPAGGAALEPLAERAEQITELLGRARELDVMLLMIRSYQHESSGLWQRAAAHAAHEIETVRADATEACTEAAALAVHPGFAAELTAATQALLGHQHEYLPPIGPEVARRFRKARKAYRDWRELDISQDLHRCRIALKKLRYAAEFYGPAYDKRMARYAAEIKTAQDLLGDWHDADVLIDALRRIACHAPYSEVQGFPLIIESFQHWGNAKVDAFQSWAKEFFSKPRREEFLSYCTEGE